jgi:sugar phosphate isomerase/epimerase
MRLSVQEPLLGQVGLDEKLRLLEESGFSGMEVMGRPEVGEKIKVYRDAISTSRIRISTICSGYPGDLLSPEKSSREQAINGIVERLRWARELGAVGVIFVPTFGQPKLPDLWPLFQNVVEVEKRLLIEEAKVLGKHAEDLGVYALLEPLNRYETHLINRAEQALEVLEAVGSEGVKMMLDFFHMNIEEANIGEAIRKAGKHLAHIHLADSNRLLPGYGHTDFSALKVLREIGYDKYGALECRIPGDPRVELPKFTKFISRFL